MAEELTPADVESYTAGRLSADDPETARALAAALARARRFCFWHVSPVLWESLTFDGDGDTRLRLPTKRVVSVDAVFIDGQPVTDYNRPVGSNVLIRDRGWPRGFSNIVIELTHGHTAAECPDWREAILRMVDRAAFIADQGGAGPLRSREVDDVKLAWSNGVDLDPDIQADLDQFRRKWYAA